MNNTTRDNIQLVHATIDQLDEIYKHFYNNRTWFPHIRKDYVARKLKAAGVVYDRGVIIIYTRYKRRQKLGDTCVAKSGDIIIHQILNVQEGNGNASIVLDDFFNSVSVNVWLTVRSSNNRAVEFYKRRGMKLVGNIFWLKRTLSGFVFLKEV